MEKEIIFSIELKNISFIKEIKYENFNKSQINSIQFRYNHSGYWTFWIDIEKILEIDFTNKIVSLQIKLLLKENLLELPKISLICKSNNNEEISYIKFSPFVYNQILKDSKEQKFNPYKNFNDIILLQNSLTFMVSNIFGHKSFYFRITPDKNNKDIVFREYTLYNVEDPKCINIIVPDNQFPDAKLKFLDYGIDYEEPFEAHISKLEFNKNFGLNSMPQKGDIIYLEINNRLYEIDSSTYDKINHPSFFKISLIKYQTKYIRQEENNKFLQNLVNTKTNSLEIFASENELETFNTIVDPQNNVKNNIFPPDQQFDKYKKYFIDVKIEKINYIYNKMLLFEYIYSFENFNTLAVQYNFLEYNKNDLPNKSINFWFQLKPSETKINFCSLNFVTNQLIINKILEDKKFAIISKFNKKLLVKINNKNIIDGNTIFDYEIIWKNFKENYLTFNNYEIKFVNNETLLEYSNISIIKYNNILQCNFGNSNIFLDLKEGVWYSFLWNYIDEIKQNNLQIFEEVFENLEIIFETTFFENINVTNILDLYSANWNFTKLRVWSQIINNNIEEIKNYILQTHSNYDTRYLICQDDCRPIVKNMYVANPK